MPRSDSSEPFMRAVRYLAFSRRPALLAGRKPGGLPVPVHEVSKRALGSQTTQARPRLAFAPRTVLPSASLKSVGVLIAYFRSSIPSPPVPLFMLHQVLHNTLCKTRGRVVRYSFLVRLFHSLLHAGLSRRTQRTTKQDRIWMQVSSYLINGSRAKNSFTSGSKSPRFYYAFRHGLKPCPCERLFMR